MKGLHTVKVLFGLLAFTILGLLAFTALDPSYQTQRETAAWTDAQRQRVAVAAEATTTALNLQRQERIAPIVTGTQIGVSISMAIAASLGVLAGVMFLILFLARRLMLVRPTATGVLPTPLYGFPGLADEARASMGAYHQTEYRRAGIQPVPQTFSPSFTHNPSHTSNGLVDELAGNPLLDAPPLALPDSAPLADYLSQARPHRLLFGIAPDGKLLQAPMAASYHMLMQGKTRSGKSNLLNLLLVQLHHQHRTYGLHTALYIGDFKREISNIWRRSSLVSLSSTEPSEIAELLKEMVHGPDGVLARQDFFDQEGRRRGRVINNLISYEQATGATLPRHYIVLDEINALLTAADDKALSGELAKLLFTGAGAGYFVLGGAHGLDAKTFDRIGREQFVTRMQFGPFDQSTVNLLFGSMKIDPADVDLLDGRGGRGLIQTVSMARPVPFQALQVEEADILPYIDQRPDDATAAAMQQLAHDAETIIIAPTAGDAPISDTVRRAVWQRKRSGLTKADIIFALWGARKGASESYRAASALYDRVLGEGPPSE